TIAPRYGAATVERIAINAVMAGCKPEYLPVLIAACEAVATKAFHLQAIQATTNPAAVWLVINGPIAEKLGVNSGGNCLGPGAWANGTLGRAMRLILQNIGGGLPGDMDKATQGQPGKWTFCCAENEAANPWAPLHVERGFSRDTSTVTVVGALGTWNNNITEKDPDNVIAMIGDTMQYPSSSDYIHGGAPWVVLSPQHAQLFKQAGWSKAEVKRRLWEASKMRAGRSLGSEFERLKNARAAELGDITPDTMLPISVKPDDITVIVAGGAGSHTVFVPVSAHTRSVTVKIPE
ncbi:MAG: UGSC family (seleno)protein, partial [Rhodospirillaceae bacterium]